MAHTLNSPPPFLDALLGRERGRLIPTGTLAVAFPGFLVLAAATACGVLEGTVAAGAFVIVMAAVAWWSIPAMAPVLGILAFAFLDGFVDGTHGSLSWHGDSDLVRLALLTLVALSASLLGRRRAMFDLRRHLIGREDHA